MISFTIGLSVDSFSDRAFELDIAGAFGHFVCTYFALYACLENVLTVYWGVPHRKLVCNKIFHCSTMMFLLSLI